MGLSSGDLLSEAGRSSLTPPQTDIELCVRFPVVSMECCLGRFLPSSNTDVTNKPQCAPLKHPQADSNTFLSCVLWNSITCSPADRISRNCHSVKKCPKSWLCPQDSILGIDYISKSLSNGQGAFYSSPCLKLSSSLLWYIMYELLKIHGLCTFPPVVGVSFVLVW